MIPDLARRRSLLTAALGFALLDTKGKPAPKEVQLVREWLDTWTGIGHVVTGMAGQDYDLELTRLRRGRGWGRDVLSGVEHLTTNAPPARISSVRRTIRGSVRPVQALRYTSRAVKGVGRRPRVSLRARNAAATPAGSVTLA